MKDSSLNAHKAISDARQRLIQAEESLGDNLERSAADRERLDILRGEYTRALLRHWPTIDAELGAIDPKVRKQSSSKLSTLAGQIQNQKPLSLDGQDDVDVDAIVDEYNALLANAQRLAGSVMGQDETPGQG